MANDLKRLMQSLFAPAAQACSRPVWRPNADLYRTKTGWLIKVDLAGVRPEDIALTVAGTRLTIAGRRRDVLLEQGCQQYQMEIAYSRFERTFVLPGPINPARVSNEYYYGMLLVRVPMEAHS